MIKLENNYSPLKVLTRIWKDEDTNQVFTAQAMIDFEDVKHVEEYVRNEIQVDQDLTFITTYTGDQYLVIGSFKVLCSEVKKARAYTHLNNLSFIKN